MQKKTKTTKTAPKPTKPTAEKPDTKLGELQTTRERKTVLMQGNEAVAYGALDAGCDFFAGYPITPSTEIAEILALELPKRGGVFVQMEDEIAASAPSQARPLLARSLSLPPPDPAFP